MLDDAEGNQLILWPLAFKDSRIYSLYINLFRQYLSNLREIIWSSKNRRINYTKLSIGKFLIINL